MNTLIVYSFIASVTFVRGGVVSNPNQADSEGAGSYQEWSTDYVDQEHVHDPHLAAHAHVQDASLWKAKEFTSVKALADHRAAVAALKVKVAAEEQTRALAFQAATQAKAAADEEAEQAIRKANEAAQEEHRALVAAQEAYVLGRQASFAATDAQNAVDELNKSYMAAQTRADQEAKNAAEKNRLAEVEREKATIATQARIAAEGVANTAAQKAKSAEEAFWKAKHSSVSW